MRFLFSLRVSGINCSKNRKIGKYNERKQKKGERERERKREAKVALHLSSLGFFSIRNISFR